MSPQHLHRRSCIWAVLPILGAILALIGCSPVAPAKTSTPASANVKGRALSDVICQASDLPAGWRIEERFTETPSAAKLPDDVVGYYGVAFSRSDGISAGGCHIVAYADEKAAHRAFGIECSVDAPDFTTPDFAVPNLGTEACAFGHKVHSDTNCVVFREGRTMVIIIVSVALDENEMQHIVEAVDIRLGD